MSSNDRGQRYEVRAAGWPAPEKTTVSFGDDLVAAHQVMQGIYETPGCWCTEVFDRQSGRVVLMLGG